MSDSTVCDCGYTLNGSEESCPRCGTPVTKKLENNFSENLNQLKNKNILDIDINHTLGLLKEYEQKNDPASYYDLALIWYKNIDSPVDAIRNIEKISSTIKNIEEAKTFILKINKDFSSVIAKIFLKKLVYIAKNLDEYKILSRLWLNIFDDEDEYFKCISRSSRFRKEVNDYLKLIEKIYYDFNEDLAKSFLLEAISKIKDAEDWINCVELWNELFFNNNEIMTALENNLKFSDNIDSLLYLTEEVYKGYSEELSIRLMNKAVEIANDYEDYKKCAKIWNNVFINDAETNKCLMIAASKINNLDELISFVKHVYYTYNEDIAADILRNSRIHLTDLKSIDKVAKVWTNLLDNSAEAAKDLSLLLKLNLSLNQYLSFIEKNINSYDEENLKKLLKDVVHLAKEGKEWNRLACMFFDLFDSEEEAMNCLQERCKQLNNINEIVEYLKTLKKDFEEDILVKLLVKNFGINKTPEDWIKCAEFCSTFDYDSKNLVFCLEKVFSPIEDAAKYFEQIDNIINKFEEDIIKNFIKKSYPLIKTKELWMKCAEYWNRTFLDDAETSICITNAFKQCNNLEEKVELLKNIAKDFDDDIIISEIEEFDLLAKTKSEWTLLGNLWIALFNDYEEALIRFAKAKDMCANFKEVAELIESIDTGKYRSEIKEWLKESEKLISKKTDWKLCAKIWEKKFDEHEEAKRCLELSK